jgi:hypothetical protein
MQQQAAQVTPLPQQQQQPEMRQQQQLQGTHSSSSSSSRQYQGVIHICALSVEVSWLLSPVELLAAS